MNNYMFLKRMLLVCVSLPYETNINCPNAEYFRSRAVYDVKCMKSNVEIRAATSKE